MVSSLWPLLLLPSSLALHPSPGCGLPPPDLPRPGESLHLQLQVEDPLLGQVSREYRLHLPLHWDLASPAPLVLDYHWYGGSIESHVTDGHDFEGVADEEEEGGPLVVTPLGMGDYPGESWRHSWNCSSTWGPLGEMCETDREVWGEAHCFSSCSSYCEPGPALHSCEWTTCYDDVFFTERLLDQVRDWYNLHKFIIQHSFSGPS